MDGGREFPPVYKKGIINMYYSPPSAAGEERLNGVDYT